MHADKRDNKIDARRILRMVIYIAIASAALMGVSLVPLMRKALAEREDDMIAREAQRAVAKYVKGLTPCAFSASDLDGWLQKYLPGRPDVSIDVDPSFSPQYSIRLVGQDLYYFEFDFPLYEASGSAPPTFNPQQAPLIFHSRVSSEIARQFPLVVANDINHARAVLGEGADGTAYFFHVQMRCARTWSPDPGTRAGDFVELSDLLAQHAKTNDAIKRAAGEQKMLAILKSLQSDQ
jgi:hypothetical protein